MCLMALMGAVLSALLKANSIQNRPLAREVDGSWLSMGVQSEGLLEGSPPFPSCGRGSLGEANSIVAQGRTQLSHPSGPWNGGPREKQAPCRGQCFSEVVFIFTVYN